MGRINTMKCIAILAIAAFALASAEVYFEEDFSGDWESRWVSSKSKEGLGAFKVSAGKFYNDAEAGKGLQTSQDAKFYAISAKTKEFSDDVDYAKQHAEKTWKAQKDGEKAMKEKADEEKRKKDEEERKKKEEERKKKEEEDKAKKEAEKKDAPKKDEAKKEL